MEVSKVLSIKNPWSYLIVTGLKDVENRTWRTKYRGKILIHSSAKWDKSVELNQLFTYEQYNAMNAHTRQKVFSRILPCSAIIGEVEIVDCIQNSESIWAVPGQWHWVLENPVFYTNYLPNVKGKLGIWNYNSPKAKDIGKLSKNYYK